MFSSLHSCFSLCLHIKPVYFVWFEHLDVREDVEGEGDGRVCENADEWQ